MNTQKALIALSLCFATAAHAQEQVGPDLSGSYLCKSIAAGGVSPEGGTWKSTTFNVSDDIRVVKVTDSGKTADVELSNVKARVYQVNVKSFGEPDQKSSIFCYDRRRDIERRHVASNDRTIRCSFIGTEYRFDFETMKFQSVFWGGYMHPDDTDTPYVSVGKCEKIE